VLNIFRLETILVYFRAFINVFQFHVNKRNLFEPHTLPLTLKLKFIFYLNEFYSLFTAVWFDLSLLFGHQMRRLDDEKSFTSIFCAIEFFISLQ